MKRFILSLVVMLGMTTAFAQTLYLVKDEGGVTNIRKGPGTSYGIASTIPDGFYVYCSNISGGWAKVWDEYTDGSPMTFAGYISTSKIVRPPHDGISRTFVQVKQEGGYTNIRKGAGSSSAIAAKVKDGSFILVNATDLYNGKAWVRVYNQKGGLRGYMSSSKMMMLEVPTIK